MHSDLEARSSKEYEFTWFENPWFFAFLITLGILFVIFSVLILGGILVSIALRELGVALIIASVLSLTLQRLERKQHDRRIDDLNKLAKDSIDKLINTSIDKIGVEVLDGSEDIWNSIREFIFQIPIIIVKDVTTISLKPFFVNSNQEHYVQLSIETHQELRNRTRNEQPYPIKVWLSSDLEFGDKGLSIKQIKYSNLNDHTQDIVFKIDENGICSQITSSKSTSELKDIYRKENTDGTTTLTFEFNKLQIKPHESFSISIFQEMTLRAEDSFYKWFNRPALNATLNLIKDFSELDKSKFDLVTEFNPVHPASRSLESEFMRKTSSLSWDIFKPFFPKNGYIIQWKLKERE